jgi:hypothetical protein
MIALCALGEPAEAEELAGPLRELGPPAVDAVAAMPYPALQSMQDPTAPYGSRNYWKSGFLDRLDHDLIDLLVEAASERVSPLTQIHIHQMGGAVGRVPSGATAFAHRSQPYLINIVGMWSDPTDDDAGLTWTRDLWSRIEHHTKGSYSNFLAGDGQQNLHDAFAPQTWARLTAIKRRWDPDEVFRKANSAEQ